MTNTDKHRKLKRVKSLADMINKQKLVIPNKKHFYHIKDEYEEEEIGLPYIQSYPIKLQKNYVRTFWIKFIK